ncbi:WD repeat-containing protein 89-like [Mya arenaria]|uniref:WD repeat-containing protein 89-like n=1 Tax=Mya arenaria TaxID=6604 RepID=UPI0022E404DB|nr:WD repeat-containing protein 89-like [Mya arenaria]
MNEAMNRLQNLCLSETSAASLAKVEEDYVLDIASQRSGNPEDRLLAATSSNFTIRLMSRNSLANYGAIKGHTEVITGICWGNTEPNLLYSCSLDKTVRCWDCRTKLSKEVQKYKGSDETNSLFSCLDVNATDELLIAGLEADKDGNAFILFWDRRNSELMGAYSESHQDDITQVTFHPTKPNQLATGSTDGLVCVFDLSEDSEDDALSYTFNTCSTVARVGWCGAGRDHVYCTTHVDGVHVWDSVEGDLVGEWTNIKEELKEDGGVDYVVDCFPGDDNQLYTLTGTNSGSLQIAELGTDQPVKRVCCLSGGHKAVVRCANWDNQMSTLVTGGEDSLLCSWSSTPAVSSPSKHSSSKAKIKDRRSTPRSRPYKR